LEYALRKYERALSESSELLNQLLQAFDTEIMRLTNVRRRVVVDIEGKGEAIRLDKYCLDTSQPHSQAPLDQIEHWKSKTMKYNWEESTNNLLQETNSTLFNAGKLRAKASMLRAEKARAEAECLQMACEALEAKAFATRGLKDSAEFELAKIQEELNLTSQEHWKLQNAIQEKTQPLTLAEERLRTRNLRPQREKIRDRAEEALEREVQQLTQSLEELTRALQAVTKNLYKLEETRKTLVLDVESKTQALDVDLQCLGFIQEARGRAVR